MGAIWVIAEPGPDGGLARISAEAATLVRELAAATGREAIGIVVAPAALTTDILRARSITFALMAGVNK